MLCGGAGGPQRANPSGLNLNLHGASRNVHLKIEDISRPLVANIPDVSADLLEVATYIYAADSASSRGGKTDAQMGARWRRKLSVCDPGPPARSLVFGSCYSLLSSRQSAFFQRTTTTSSSAFLKIRQPVEGYFEFSGEEPVRFTPDEVILFSGGWIPLQGRSRNGGAGKKSRAG